MENLESGPPLDIDAIEARAEAATPGPWGAADEHGAMLGATPAWCISKMGDGDKWLYDIAYIDQTHKAAQVDAEFMAAARTDVPALCAEVRQLRADKANLEQALGLYQDETRQLRAENEQLIQQYQADGLEATGEIVQLRQALAAVEKLCADWESLVLRYGNTAPNATKAFIAATADLRAALGAAVTPTPQDEYCGCGCGHCAKAAGWPLDEHGVPVTSTPEAATEEAMKCTSHDAMLGDLRDALMDALMPRLDESDAGWVVDEFCLPIARELAEVEDALAALRRGPLPSGLQRATEQPTLKDELLKQPGARLVRLPDGREGVAVGGSDTPADQPERLPAKEAAMNSTVTTPALVEIIETTRRYHVLVESGAYAHCSCGVEFYFQARHVQYQEHREERIANAVLAVFTSAHPIGAAPRHIRPLGPDGRATEQRVEPCGDPGSGIGCPNPGCTHDGEFYAAAMRVAEAAGYDVGGSDTQSGKRLEDERQQRREAQSALSAVETVLYGTDWTGSDPIVMRDQLRAVLTRGGHDGSSVAAARPVLADQGEKP